MTNVWFLKIIMRQKSFWVGLLLVLILLPAITPEHTIWLATEAIIFSLFAISLNILLGYGGMISFGHAAYFAVGGYACALLLKDAGVPMGLSIFLSPFISALIALVFGWFCVRVTHLYFALLTMAFAQLIWAFVFKSSFTGAQDGIIGIPLSSTFYSTTNYYYLVLGIVVISILLITIIVNSPFGQMLKASRENEQRTRFIGLNVRWHRLAAFVIAGFFAGLAGALLVLLNRGVFPEIAYWTVSGEVLLMCLLGGTDFLLGPAVGAWALVFLRKYVTDYITSWELVLGAILIFIVLLMPQGIAGLGNQVVKRTIKMQGSS